MTSIVSHQLEIAHNFAESLSARIFGAQGRPMMLMPATAARILQELNFPGQRKLDSGRVYGHRHAIIKGDWEEGHVITLVRLPDGRLWLVDGQHRLTAISQHTQAVPVTLRMVEVGSEEQARSLYAGFDMRKSVRTDRQILDAVGVAEENGLTPVVAGALYAATPLLLNDLEPIVGSVNIQRCPEIFLQHNRMKAVSAWAAEAREYEGIVARARTALRAKMRSPGVMAAALYTLRFQPVRAREFWTGVADNDGLRKNDPRATLIADLLTRAMNAGSVRQRVQQPILAWNAFCEGRDLKIIKCIEGSPIAVWGTPLAKRRA